MVSDHQRSALPFDNAEEPSGAMTYNRVLDTPNMEVAFCSRACCTTMLGGEERVQTVSVWNDIE